MPPLTRPLNVLRVQARLSDLSRYHGGVAAPDAGRAPITWFSDTVPMALCGGVHAHSATHTLPVATRHDDRKRTHGQQGVVAHMRSRRLTTLASVEGFEQRIGGCSCGPGPKQLAGRLGWVAHSKVSAAPGPQARTAGKAVLLALRVSLLLPTCAVLEFPVPWRRSTLRDIAFRSSVEKL